MKNKKLIVIILMLAFFGVCSFTYGKYASNSVKDYYLKSKGFYFTSDYLSLNGTQNVNNLWDGTSVYFNLKNNLNQNVITNYDINYQVTCEIEGEASNYTACHLNGTNESTVTGTLSSSEYCSNSTSDEVDVSQYDKATCEVSNYDWLSQISIGELYFDIVKTDEAYSLKDITVNITATSTSPYEKVLTGKFILNKVSGIDDEITLNYINNSTYDSLIISNSYSVTKCLTINFDSTKTHINSENLESPVTDENGYINQFTVNIEGKKSINYTFYPVSETTNSDFTITENSCQ